MYSNYIISSVKVLTAVEVKVRERGEKALITAVAHISSFLSIVLAIPLHVFGSLRMVQLKQWKTVP